MDEAIDTVARELILRAVDGTIDWEDYPHIGENDWELVIQRVNGIVNSIAPLRPACYSKAYALLVDRAVSVVS